MKKYCLIGEKLSHSHSPLIQNQLFMQNGAEASYSLMEVPRDGLADALKLIKNEYAGCNVTVPYKTDVISCLDGLSDEALSIGAVNTVVNQNGRLIGYNTDGIGFMRSLPSEFAPKGKDVLLLGAGGSARAIAYVLAKAGAGVSVYNRHVQKAQQLVQKMALENIKAVTAPELYRRWALIINTTPLGMYPDNIGKSALAPQETAGADYVYDCVYNPPDTLFLRQFKSAGSIPVSGLSMLLYQAVEAQKLWGTLREEKDLDEIKALLYETGKDEEK